MSRSNEPDARGGETACKADDADDLHAYIEYSQSQLLTPGWEQTFDASTFLRWVHDNQARLMEMAVALGSVEPDRVVGEHLHVVGAFDRERRFDSPQTRAIFGPLLDEVRAAARVRRLATSREIHLATSTDAAPSPASLPSAGEHVLFIGPGTSAFCNYWAKAYTFVVKAAAAHSLGPIREPADLQAALRKDPLGLVLATRLALYSAFFGTALGFGEVVPPPSHASYRLELLRAMELFAVAHEFGHFLAEERLPALRGQLDVAGQRQLETFCDEVALALSRDCCGSSYLAFCGVGAVVLLRSAEVSEAARSAIVASGKVDQARMAPGLSTDSSHPSAADRVAAVKSWVEQGTDAEQRDDAVRFLAEFDLIATLLNTEVLRMIEGEGSGAGVR